MDSASTIKDPTPASGVSAIPIQFHQSSPLAIPLFPPRQHAQRQQPTIPLFPPQQHAQRQQPAIPLFPPQQHAQRQQPAIPLFPPQQHAQRQQPAIPQDLFEILKSFSAYSTSSQVTQQEDNFSIGLPGIEDILQQYSFVSHSRKQMNLSRVTEDFPATLTSMESSKTPESKKPPETSASTGTYTCTYHGCTFRLDTLEKLLEHKRTHRKSAAEGGETSAEQRRSQTGPRKCKNFNSSTGKTCNIMFSRPYDLTRHEDTVHNRKKQKIHCALCTTTFNRRDALRRHIRVVHPGSTSIDHE